MGRSKQVPGSSSVQQCAELARDQLPDSDHVERRSLRVRITVPEAFRVRRTTPRDMVVRHADLSDTDIASVEGVPTTTVRRTIEASFRTHLGPALLRQAIEDGERQGYLKPDEARELRKLVLP